MDQPLPPPSPLLMFIIMFVLVGGAVGLMFVLSAITRGWRSLTSPEAGERARRAIDAGVQRLERRLSGADRPASRSPRLNYRSNGLNGVQERSPRLNAENASVQRSPSVQTVQQTEPLMPRDMDELRKLIEAHALYARRANKQIAIEAAWKCKKGEGPEWARASALFDALNPGLPKAPRGAAEEKPVADSELRMEPVP